MADSKTIAPEVRACGDVLATMAGGFDRISSLARMAIDKSVPGRDDGDFIVLMQTIISTSDQLGALADRTADLAGRGRLKSDLEWLAAPRDIAAMRALGDQQAAQVAVD